MGGEGRCGVAPGHSVCVDVMCVGGRMCVLRGLCLVYGVCDVDGWVCMCGCVGCVHHTHGHSCGVFV